MAKKKTSKPKPKAPATPTDTADFWSNLQNKIPNLTKEQKAAIQELGGGFGLGQALSDKFFPEGGAPQLDASRSGEMSDVLKSYGRLSDTAGVHTPEEDAFTRALQTQAAGAGTMTPEMRAALDIQRQRATQGLAAPEFNALRESMREGQASDTATAMRLQAQQNAMSGVRGMAAGARFDPLNRAIQEQQRNLNRDLYLANVDYRTQAMDTYGRNLGEQQQNLFTNQNTANTAYGTRLDNMGTRDYNRLTSATDAYANTLSGLRADEVGRQQQNIDYSNQYKAGALGALGGGAGLLSQTLASNKANKLAAQQLGFAKKNY